MSTSKLIQDILLDMIKEYHIMLKPEHLKNMLETYADDIMNQFHHYIFNDKDIKLTKILKDLLLVTPHEIFRDGLNYHTHLIQIDDNMYREYDFSNDDEESEKYYSDYCIVCSDNGPYLRKISKIAKKVFYNYFPEIYRDKHFSETDYNSYTPEELAEIERMIIESY